MKKRTFANLAALPKRAIDLAMIVCRFLKPGAKLLVERELATKHIADRALALDSVSSSFVEDRCNELAARDHRRDRPQVVYGLLCNRDGCPVAMHVFPGNTADPNTFAEQVASLCRRFGLERVTLVGDRGLIARTRIEKEFQPAGLNWVANRKSRIRQVRSHASRTDLGTHVITLKKQIGYGVWHEARPAPTEQLLTEASWA